jgi:putative MFS transporter
MADTGSHTRDLQRIAQISGRLERLPWTRYQLGIFAVIATAWLFDSIDLGALTFLLGSIRKEFGLTLTGAGVLSSMSFVGMLFGAALSGFLADRYGRLAVFQSSMLIWGFGSLFCGLAPTLYWLMAARIVVGFGMGMEFPVAQAIAAEIAPKAHRGRLIAVLEGFWPCGFILAGTIALVLLPIASWRTVFIVESLPAVFVFIVRRTVFESPRWLADRGRYQEAEEVMAEMERRVRRRYKADLPQAVPELLPAPPENWRDSFGQLVTGEYLRRTVMIWLVWFFAMLGYYGLTTWLGAILQHSGKSVVTSVEYTIWISCAGIPGFATAAWLVEKWGRRATAASFMVGGALFCFLYGGVTKDLFWMITWGAMMQFCLFGMWSAIYAYTPELYPTRARATGAGAASAVGRIGSIIGPPVVGVILANGPQIYVFLLGAAAFVLAAIVILTLGDDVTGETVEVAAP